MKNKKKLCTNIFLIIIFLLMFVICSSSMFAQDEYNYSNISNSNGERVEDIGDIISSQIFLYKNWTGRVLATGLTQLFLMLGTKVYYIINPLIFICFIVLIGKILGGKNSILSVSSTCFLILWTTSVFWEKYIWISGSFNYLWPATGMLIVMYYFYRTIIIEEKLKKRDAIILPIISFMTGWSQENVAFVTGMFLIILVLFNIKKILKSEKREKVTLITSIILFGIGAMGLIFAPGNFARMNSSTGTHSLEHIIENLKAIRYLITIFIITSTIIYFFIKDKRKTIGKELLYFILPMLIALIPMIIIPEFPARSMLAYELCIIIATTKNVEIIEENLKGERKGLFVVTSIAVILAIYPMMHKASFAYKYIKPYREQLQLAIDNGIQKGEKDIVVPKFEYYENAKQLEVLTDIFPKESDICIINTYMSIYYGVDSISAIPRGTIILEADLEGEDSIQNYNMVSKLNGQIMSSRILGTELQMPNMNYQNRMVFIIPESYLQETYLDVPKEIQDKITHVFVKNMEGKTEIPISQIVK